MYKAFGMDPSLDAESTWATTLASFRPQNFSLETPEPLDGNFAKPFSIDAPVSHQIPCDTPRVPLPPGYFRNGSAQVYRVHGFDGVGYSVAVSGGSTRVVTFHGDIGETTFTAHVPEGDLFRFLPDNAGADREVVFIDSTDKRVLDCFYGEPGTDSVNSARAEEHTLPTLGDYSGTIASGMATLAGIVRAGEATNPDKPIGHALYFSSKRMWKARVYPAHTATT